MSRIPASSSSVQPWGLSPWGNAEICSPAAAGPWLPTVELARAKLIGSFDQCVAIEPIIAPVLELLSDPTTRASMITSDVLQEFYGALVVKVAEGYINVREKGNNAGVDVESFQKEVKIGKGNAWCAAFAFACHVRAARMLRGNTTAPQSGNASAMWFHSKNKNTCFTAKAVYEGLASPRPGDLFVFDKVLDTAGAASRDMKKSVSAADRSRAASLLKAKNDKLAGDELTAAKNAAKETYDQAVADATKARDARTKGMTDGAKLYDGFSKKEPFVGGHTGVVKSFNAGEKTIVTIEGNTSSGEYGSREGDGVFERTDRMDVIKGRKKYPQLFGFVRPKFVIV